MTGIQATDRTRARYIAGAATDNLWIILSPALALALLYLLWSYSGYSEREIYAVLFAFIVTGHHMPGWLRAFGEPTVYARHKARLWVSLLAVPALVLVPTWLGLGVVALCVAAAFDLWHVAMQQHGFGRIYGAKAGDVGKRSARLDLLCVLTWYATVVAWSDAWMQAIAYALRTAGLDLFAWCTPTAWLLVKVGLSVASVGLLVAYLTVAVEQWRQRRTVAVQKHLLHLVAFAVLAISYQEASWYRANAIQNLFHATQYFCMVWIFGALSIRRRAERPRAFYRLLFGSRGGLLPYAFLIGAYGGGAWLLASSSYRLDGAAMQDLHLQLIGSIGVASLLLHYYVDSFIWKVRAKEVQATLAIDGAGSGAGPGADQLRGAAHAVGYFGVPTLLVLLIGLGGRDVGEPARAAALAHEAELFPRSVRGLVEHGQAAIDAGRIEVGRRVFEAAFELAPTYDGPARMLAALAKERGDTAAELEYRAHAARADPTSALRLYELARAQWAAGQAVPAEATLLRVLSLEPGSAVANENLGVVYRTRGELDKALQHFRRAHALDPDLSPVVCSLAGTLASLDRMREALAVLQPYCARHPDDRVAVQLAAEIRAAMGK